MRWSLLLALSACSSAPPKSASEPVVPPETTPVVASPPKPPRPAGAALALVPIDDIVSLSVGDEHACVARGDGHVWCWGNGATYRLGNGVIEASQAPARVPTIDRVVEVAAGGSMTCATKSDRTVVCWGGYRQVPGDEDGLVWPLVRLPQTIAYPVSWMRQVSVGWVQAVTLDASGGLAILDAYVGPVPLPAFEPAKAIAALSDGFCALTRSGNVQCVSSGEVGSTGDGGGGGGFGMEPSYVLAPLHWDEKLRPRFVDANGETNWAPCNVAEGVAAPNFCSARLSGVVSIAAHEAFACAVLDDGRLACWGCARCWDDKRPPLGLPEVAPSVPFFVEGARDVAQVAIGQRHICTLHKDGVVRCWGDDLVGQLGPAGDGASAKPVAVPGLGDVLAIDAGAATTCALRKDRTAVCWGQRLGTALPSWEEQDGPDDAEVDPPVTPTTPIPLVTERSVSPEGGAPAPEVCRDVEVFDRNGELLETRNRYDAKGQLVETQVWRWDGAALQPVRTTRYTRNAKGHATRVAYREYRPGEADYLSSERFRYDARGNVVWRKGDNRVDDSAVTLKWDASDRIIEIKSDWATTRFEWRPHATTDPRFAGLTLYVAIPDSDQLPSTLAITLRYADDANGRRVYELSRDPERDFVETWTTYGPADGPPNAPAIERHALLTEPFFDDPIERWEQRYTYKDGRRVQSELYESIVDPETGRQVESLTTRELSFYTGCL